MSDLIGLISSNKEWIFSGIGIPIVIFLINFFKKKEAIDSINLENTPTPTEKKKEKTLEDYKNETKILFIDDENFKVVNILKNAGWVHTKRLKDCKSLDISDITQADILFIDIQGVGKELNFQDEGLGLALALKERYSSKKIIIYSAETQGDRFHKALTQVDFFLAKNSDSYEFQKLVEEYTIGDN